MEKIIKKDI